MAEYAANILKTDPTYYTLSQATLSNGQLHLSAGGWAETEITSTQLVNLTEHFRIAYIADRYCDSYTSDIRIIVYAKDTGGNCYNYTFFPCDTDGNLYMQEFQAKATPYETLKWRIESDVPVTLSLWELCPEADNLDVQTIIDGVSQALPRLLYDYNTCPLTVGQAESVVGLITFRLMDKTDLQGHFIMSFYASKQSVLTIRFYTNEIEELFAPLTYDIKQGYNSVGIPHCYLHRAAGIYSIAATAQLSVGQITIPTRGVLYSIDGGYLARRELDVAMDVQDLAIRQTHVSYGPDEVWLIGIDAGEILVRKRDYNEINPNVGWTAVTSLGRGIAAAVEFNGYWNLRENANKYTIETDEVPWYFWVTEDNNLYGQLGSQEDTLVLLATDVTMVHACRGYSSVAYPEQDQGLVVVYLKSDGSAYYRSYSYNSVLQQVVWELEQPILEGETFVHINVHRLNDYRLSIELSTGDQNIWLYTDRTYVAQSVPPEFAFIMGHVREPGMFVNLAGYYPSDVVYPTIEFLSARAWEEDQNGVHKYYWEYTFDHAIFGSQRLWSYYGRCTFTGIQAPALEAFTPDFEEGVTRVVVSSSQPATSLITTITISYDTHMRYIDNGVVYPLQQVLTGTLDNTNYITQECSDGIALSSQSAFGVTYLSLAKMRLGQSEETSLPNTITRGAAYRALTYSQLAQEDQTSIAATPHNASTAYLDIRFDPI